MHYKFATSALEELEWLALNDRKSFIKVNKLLRDIAHVGDASGEGCPELLKGDLSGFYSRKVNKKDRLIYRTVGTDILILQCRMHYGDH